MNADLSRRVGAVMLRPAIAGLPGADHAAFTERVDAADTFDDLAAADRALVLRAEAERPSPTPKGDGS